MNKINASDVAKDIWSAICCNYGIDPRGQVTPIFWIEAAIINAYHKEIKCSIPECVGRVDLITGKEK